MLGFSHEYGAQKIQKYLDFIIFLIIFFFYHYSNNFQFY